LIILVNTKVILPGYFVEIGGGDGFLVVKVVVEEVPDVAFAHDDDHSGDGNEGGGALLNLQSLEVPHSKP
jgi:hypothetical protein